MCIVFVIYYSFCLVCEVYCFKISIRLYVCILGDWVSMWGYMVVFVGRVFVFVIDWFDVVMFFLLCML